MLEILLSHKSSGLSVLRMFRLIRLVKLIRLFPRLQTQLFLMLSTVENVATFFLLLLFTLFLSGLLGMALFGCRLCSNIQDDESNSTLKIPTTFDGTCRYQILPLSVENIEKESSAHHAFEDCLKEPGFDSILDSLFTVLQVLTRDNWADIMSRAMEQTGFWSSSYFLFLVIVGDYIIFNLLIGILVEGFSSEQEALVEARLKRRSAISQKSMISSVAQTLSGNDEKSRKIEEKNTNYWFRTLFTTLNSSDRSIFIFSNRNRIRQLMTTVMESELFETAFLIVTLASCALIVAERPSIERDSMERQLLTIGGHVLFVLFLIEAVVKIISLGFVFHRGSYLRSPANVLDFALLILATADVTLQLFYQMGGSNNKALISFLRPIKILRALRPLRLISRSQGLKVVMQTLVLSLKPVGNISRS